MARSVASWTGSAVMADGHVGWHAVDLRADRQGRGVADHDVGVRRAHGTQADRGREGEVVHEDGVGTHALDDADRPPGHELRPPQEIDGASLRLEAQGLEHASARGREEGLQRTSLGAGCPVRPRRCPRWTRAT